MRNVLVTGGAGFIGHHLCRYLKGLGYQVYGVDIKPLEESWGNPTDYDVYEQVDLRNYLSAHKLMFMGEFDDVYALAADMGGMGFIGEESNNMAIMRNNSLININTLNTAKRCGVSRYLFTSSACVYPEHLQLATDASPLKEHDAYPALPDTVYGWEKLFSEILASQYAPYMDIRIARFHNIFGPEGSWDDGREKLPAAACRKVAMAKGDHDIEVWGDGEQTRSFCYIDDCLEMLYALMNSDYDQPLNIGTDRSVTVNEMFDIVADIAGIKISKVHDLTKPQGVRGRNADLSLMKKVLGIEPIYTLEAGLEKTYRWIAEELNNG